MMKETLYFNKLIILILCGIAGSFLLSGCHHEVERQISAYDLEVIEDRTEKNDQFRYDASSPIPDSLRSSFQGLRYFPVDTQYKTLATIILNPDPQPFEMATTTERRPLYLNWGKLRFSLHGLENELEVYQNIEITANPAYSRQLFIPFRDLTSGKESYGGGRYIDIEIPVDSVLYLDFNTAYNPYCAYNIKYSCPIPPSNNNLNIPIEAGEKKPDFQ